jgi:hypothetical protein
MRFRVIWILEGMTTSLWASFPTQDEANAFAWQKILADDDEKIQCIDVVDNQTPVLLNVGI